MKSITKTEKEILDRFGWSLVKPGGSQGGRDEYFLTHPLLYGNATMAIPVDLEHSDLKQCVASAARSFSTYRWMRNADLSKYDDDPMISLETRVKGDAEYAQRELHTLCKALGIF